jgi:A/G-specific adenine glycosylase
MSFNKANFRKKLLGWFKKNQRSLPWRLKKSPYRTWISEMMLQQTQVKTVVPYYNRWMKALPSIKALHAADEKDVLTLWQGLGYYKRARQLKKAASFLVEQHGGTFPDQYESMIQIPGIGPYSAGAILSLAFDKRVPIVDGNILRVFSRLFAISKPIDLPQTHERIRNLEAGLLTDKGSGMLNESLMELGALICTSKNPRCQACPVKSHCLAYKKNKVHCFPKKNRKVQITKVKAYAVIAQKNQKFFLQRRPEGELMGGLWEFPEWKAQNKLNQNLDDQKKEISNHFNTRGANIVYVNTIKRHYTRFAEELNVYKIKPNCAFKAPQTDWPSRWLKFDELPGFPLTSAHAKIRQWIIQENGSGNCP